MILLLVLVIAIAAVTAVFSVRRAQDGGQVKVTVDGEEYGTYSLSEDRRIPIEKDGTVTNLLVIREGKADMIEATCPDHLCVRQKAIDADGETIVCLPNRVVAEVESGHESELDNITN